ncbi:MAG: threonine aldolase [Phycisphaeraceae bacterium]|nr:threonine aldolase [Phycisphaeraceae bacterium]MCB9847188.1 threonine aldolase [Phycisphaeraceae bacterium]
MPSPRSLRSDNNAGLCPQAAHALIACATDHTVGYGDDQYTARAVAAIRTLFGSDAEVFFVATGTAANTLAIAALTEPWQAVLCHHEAHWAEDESTAPERFTGCRTVPIHPAGDSPSKITPEDVERAADASRGDVHQPAPGALTISNATEFGTTYTPEEVRDLCDAAHRLDRIVHIDGARFANAVAHLTTTTGAKPADICRAMTSEAGLDALSLGGTKAGMALGEAVVFFPNEFNTKDGRFDRAVRAFPYLRKGTGHLLSKHRFVTAPFVAMLESGAWVRHAATANGLAAHLAKGLTALGYRIEHPVESNAVFVTLTQRQHEQLTARGHGYYCFGPQRNRLARLMCSFDTTPDDINAFLQDANELA